MESSIGAGSAYPSRLGLSRDITRDVLGRERDRNQFRCSKTLPTADLKRVYPFA